MRLWSCSHVRWQRLTRTSHMHTAPSNRQELSSILYSVSSALLSPLASRLSPFAFCGFSIPSSLCSHPVVAIDAGLRISLAEFSVQPYPPHCATVPPSHATAQPHPCSGTDIRHTVLPAALRRAHDTNPAEHLHLSPTCIDDAFNNPPTRSASWHRLSQSTRCRVPLSWCPSEDSTAHIPFKMLNVCLSGICLYPLCPRYRVHPSTGLPPRG
ncbi:hypothetical protein EJ04DRAFT_73297 [Polyplosphaeria fusca]|uniref:Uncharacterized protein n=1 Tax=Polyplosphaeria fusca TaxID=682080 RepID=A0A9P4QQU5_9PLEO|nr:hypothetical protein EJ04DRAFT_73297 [Polyplosphaeria fusca]